MSEAMKGAADARSTYTKTLFATKDGAARPGSLTDEHLFEKRTGPRFGLLGISQVVYHSIRSDFVIPAQAGIQVRFVCDTGRRRVDDTLGRETIQRVSGPRPVRLRSKPALSLPNGAGSSPG